MGMQEGDAVNAVVEYKEPKLPAPVERRGISEAQWRTLVNNLFPGAKSESVLMVWDYCVARKLDPLKKPCHIVPMKVRQGDEYVWRDVVMPGIYEYRTTAARTGQYMGHSVPVYGEIIEHLGRRVPEFCSITVYRWNPEAQQRAEYPVTVWFEECCATTKERGTGVVILNDRWNKAPRQMLTKCTEAAALREAFPDELGGTHTADEMEGQPIEAKAIDTSTLNGLPKIDPRGDTSGVDWELANKHVQAIREIVESVGKDDATKDEYWGAAQLRKYVAQHLAPDPEMYIVVNDKLAAEKVLSKKQFRDYLSLVLEGLPEAEVP
jgi:phage recombination protein Bet